MKFIILTQFILFSLFLAGCTSPATLERASAGTSAVTPTLSQATSVLTSTPWPVNDTVTPFSTNLYEPTPLPFTFKGPINWQVEFIQENKVISPQTNGRFQLSKSPFTIRFTLPKPLAVQLNLFDTPRNFEELKPGLNVGLKHFAEYCVRSDGFSFPFCPGTSVSEGSFNDSKNLYSSVEIFHYLYYTDEYDHRWDKVEITPEQTIFERDVLYISNTPIYQFEKEALYLTIFVDYHEQEVVNDDELKKIMVLFE